LPGDVPEPYGILLCVRCGAADKAGPVLYTARFVRDTLPEGDLTVDVGGGLVLAFVPPAGERRGGRPPEPYRRADAAPLAGPGPQNRNEQVNCHRPDSVREGPATGRTTPPDIHTFSAAFQCRPGNTSQTVGRGSSFSGRYCPRAPT